MVNAVVMHGLVTKYFNVAGEKDSQGNLPLHLFLESCLIECERAKEIGFANDYKDYDNAVVHCFWLLLAACPEALVKENGYGRLPLHLAIENVSHRLPFDSILQPLLHLAPGSLLVRDPKTQLHPLASAAVGKLAKIDTVCLLLRRDPGSLKRARSRGSRQLHPPPTPKLVSNVDSLLHNWNQGVQKVSKKRSRSHCSYRNK